MWFRIALSYVLSNTEICLYSELYWKFKASLESLLILMFTLNDDNNLISLYKVIHLVAITSMVLMKVYNVYTFKGTLLYEILHNLIGKIYTCNFYKKKHYDI